MNTKELTNLLEKVKDNRISIEEAVGNLKQLPFSDLGFAKVDHHRELRQGYPEIIYCQGKTTEHVVGIVKSMLEKGSNILGTRATEEMYEAIKAFYPVVQYHPLAKTITIKQKEQEVPSSYIVVVTGGTSDIPVSEEAAITAEILGNKVERVYDVGVAGIHRLFANIDIIRGAQVVIAVAGMEGALGSVIGGLVEKPVIAVPTSVGYGANFGGLAPLLSMLNSCSSGTAVVNIDNGFGAGYMASMINHL
ncbi:nickel pincer cofactor biosynthesis protein LarB [Alkaliphilus hydrothermalis]|uniref:NCAIR mutase (PurE)-related protein n=1 Tax=Alkaliphilus hydrothermalis TaxID=1482730 RepID=A0ABS2NTY0_9FIRM|nr:nickel pincer cofactor biosynthesis protein LarB [Alkaliphilus hydrothermalis]MBM7616361.1 NCAIR mutase (PurE)-related protein [Alkaliphilus hydrothermalis]